MSSILLPTVIGLVFALTGIALWPLYFRRGEPWLRRRVSERYGVTIVNGARGHWHIEGGGVRGFFIELIQLAGYMATFVVWSVWIGIGLLLAHLAEG